MSRQVEERRQPKRASVPPREGGDADLRPAVEAIADQLCRAVDGGFDFTVHVDARDDTIEKLEMVVNLALHSAKRSLGKLGEQTAAQQRLEAERLTAEAANQAKSEFLANMSHEIRTPMTAIQGFADALLDPELDEQARLEAVQTIRRNGAYLLRIINDILDISKIEAGKMTVEPFECSPFEVIAELTQLVRVRIEESQLGFQVSYPTPLPEIIVTDPMRLRQILVNLTGNAIKFTQTGEVRIEVSAHHTESNRPKIQFDVIDTGIGIADEQKGILFDPFVQADESMSRRFGGTGLGLAISRRLARMLGGDVELVESQLGIGTHFRATITATVPEGTAYRDRPVRALPDAPAPTTETTLSGRILVAEDGVDNRRLIGRILEKAGLEVTFAEDGQLALEQVLAADDGGEPFDVVLMDLQMPRLDGYEATRMLRERGYPGAIVALTAHAMESERDRAIAAGCDDFETKPIDRKNLLETLSAHLTQKSKEC